MAAPAYRHEVKLLKENKIAPASIAYNALVLALTCVYTLLCLWLMPPLAIVSAAVIAYLLLGKRVLQIVLFTLLLSAASALLLHNGVFFALVPALLIPALVVRFVLLRKRPYVEGIGYTALSVLLLAGAFVALATIWSGQDFPTMLVEGMRSLLYAAGDVEGFRDMLESSVASFQAAQSNAVTDAGLVALLGAAAAMPYIELVETFLAYADRVARTLLPALIVGFSLLSGLVVYAIPALAMNRAAANEKSLAKKLSLAIPEITKLTPLREWAVPRFTGWTIFGLGVVSYFCAGMGLSVFSSVLPVLITIYILLYLLQGMLVMAFMLLRTKMHKVVIVLLVAFLTAFLPVTVLFFGISDAAFHIRGAIQRFEKMRAEGKAPPPSSAWPIGMNGARSEAPPAPRRSWPPTLEELREEEERDKAAQADKTDGDEEEGGTNP